MSARAASNRSGSGHQAPVRIIVGWLLVVALVVGVLPAVAAAPSVAQPAHTGRPFERVGAITLPGQTGLASAVIDPAGRFAYFGTGTSPARVVKLDLTTFSPAATLTLTVEGELGSAVIDPAGRFAYFGTAGWKTPVRIVKIDLVSFTHAGTLTLPETTP
jgi:hypothetical protein